MDSRKSSEAGGASKLALEPRLAGHAAVALARTVREYRGTPLDIDASQVVEIGTLCLQVLLSAALTWRSDRESLSLVDPSEAFMTAMGHLGLNLDALQSAGAAA